MLGKSQPLDALRHQTKFEPMSILELKEAASRLSKREREELHAYLIRLRHDTPEWKRKTARTIRAMKAGKRVSLEQLEARIGRG
jgi:hypothetical protein